MKQNLGRTAAYSCWKVRPPCHRAAGCRGVIRGAKSLVSDAHDGRRQQAVPCPQYTAQEEKKHIKSLLESGVRIFSLVVRVFMNYLIS